MLNEVYSLLLQEVDKFNFAVFAKVPLELILVEDLEIFDVSDVHVPRSTVGDRHAERRADWAWVLAPTDLEATVVEGQALVSSHLIESEGSVGVHKRDELSRKTVSSIA